MSTKLQDQPDTAVAPTERPTLADTWTLLIVEMRRNDLPAPFEISFNPYNMSYLSVLLMSADDVSVWAKHFGQTVLTRRLSNDAGWKSEALFRWKGYQVEFGFTAWDKHRPEPIVHTTDALVDELAADLAGQSPWIDAVTRTPVQS